MLGYAIYTFRLQSYEKASKKPKENSFFFVFSSESNFSRSERVRSFRDITKGYGDLFFFFCIIIRQMD